MSKIKVENAEITVIRQNDDDFISLTDMAKSQFQEHIIFRWLSLKSTIEYLGEWELLYNPNFNYTEFGTIKNMAGSNNFVLSVKTWIEKTNAIEIVSKAGRYGGTYAHRDIAYHFGMWISPRFQLLLVKEYQRLKSEEQKFFGWSAKRELSKINYRIHTDAIKQNFVPEEITPAQKSFIYADEADMLNVAMFGMTAKEWKEQNPKLKGNIRDYATINQLICLSNMENLNAVFINDLKLGKDFIFIDEEYRVQVGNTDFFIDLLFYHRELQCLVAIELKTGKFKPEHLGQLNFYLEALDRDVRKPKENPSIGILLCRDKDDDVVEYALSRSLSPAMVAEYKLHLPDKKVLQSHLKFLLDNELEEN